MADVRAQSPASSGAGASGGSHGPIALVQTLLAPERSDLAVVALFAIGVGILNLATPIAVQAIVNSIALGGLLQPLLVIALFLAAALSFAAALTMAQTWFVELVQRRLFVRTLADVAARLIRVRGGAYAEGHGPEIVNRFFDVVTVQKALSKLILDGLVVLLGVVVGLAVLAFYHPLLLAFDVVLLLIIVVIVLGPRRGGEKTSIKESSAKYAVVAWLEDLARNPHAFKVKGAEQWVLERTDMLADRWLSARQRHFSVLFGQIGSALALQVVASTALLGIGGLLVIGGSLTLGQLVAAELIVTNVVSSVAKLGRYIEHWYDLTAAAHKLDHLLDLPLEPLGGEVPPPSATKGARLELDGIAWKDGRGRPVFEVCSAEVGPGERLAIVGPSGSGKSALLELLWRMHDPHEGAIRLDGRDLRDLDLAVLRKDVALVSAVEVVHGTLRENISLARPDVSGDDIRRAIRAVGLEAAIAELPDGLDTELHPTTRALSKGELERLMLARGLAGSPRLLVVDGMFDRLAAPLREELLEATLLSPAREWTLVLVTQDEALAARCERVLRLVQAKQET